MTQSFGTNMQNIANNDSGQAPVLADSSLIRGKMRKFIEYVPLASQALSSNIVIARIPKNAVFLGVEMTTDTSLGSATFSIQDFAPSPNSYIAAGKTLTTTNAATKFTSAAFQAKAMANPAYDYNGQQAPYMDIAIVLGTQANLPASGNLTVETNFITFGD